jgi:hypothetical protein
MNWIELPQYQVQQKTSVLASAFRFYYQIVTY